MNSSTIFLGIPDKILYFDKSFSVLVKVFDAHRENPVDPIQNDYENIVYFLIFFFIV